MPPLRKLLVPLKTLGPAGDGPIVAATRVAGTPASYPPPVEGAPEVVEAAQKLDRVGQYAQSLALVNAALVASPDDPDLLQAKASTLFAWGRFHEAHNIALRSEALGPSRFELCLLLGWLGFRVGILDDAEAWMRKACYISPDAWEGHFNLAVVLQAKKSSSDAIAHYEKALELHPGDFECLLGLGNCFLDSRDPASAETFFRWAIALESGRPEAFDHLGVALAQQDRVDEAQAAFDQSARVEAENGQSGTGFVNLAVHMRDFGRTSEALDLFQRNLKERPSVFGQLCYAHGLLRAGRLLDGWNQYEFRWLSEPLLSLRVDYRRPSWTGQDLHGKTILLREEQGLGDTIQFIRYAPFVKSLGATVLFRVGAVIENLARCFPGVDRVLGPADATPEFDFLIHPLSLPRVFGTDLESIPAESPYLQAKAELVERWSQRLEAQRGIRVGLAWAGSPLHQKDKYRSIPLNTLAPLTQLKGFDFISLQKGPAAQEIANSVALEIVNLGSELDDLCDTAAVISQLDLLICVDTAVAHLAGALGKPVWLMLPRTADFRWMEGRDDSPWYPTMRLFRQTRVGEWGEVVDRIITGLAQLLEQPRTTADTTGDEQAKATPEADAPKVADLSTLTTPGLSAVAETRMGLLQYLPDEPIVGPSITWYGDYLHSQLLLLTHIVQPGAVIMEVGAGIGAHSVVLARTVGSDGHVFLYEPRSVMQQILRQNCSANRISNVTIMKRALGAPKASSREPTKEAAEIDPAVRDQVMSETVDELQLDRLDWVKINSGPKALQVLDGASDTLWRLRPSMFIAAEDESTLNELKDRALEFSYRCWRMDSALFNPENFNRRDTDIFLGRTAISLLALPEELSVDIEFDRCVELR